MLDQLRQIAIFAKTVEYGSFRSAAKALNLSPSVVSHHVAQLEERLGTALLYRSTRRLSLTSDGEALLVSAREMIEAAELGLRTVGDKAGEPSGVLRVTTPAVLAQSEVVDRIAEFANAFPLVQLELDFTDLQRNVITDGIDVAIRMGWLRDSALMARKFDTIERKVVAAQRYVARHQPPARPADLEGWNWIEFSQVSLKVEFRRRGYRAAQVRPKSNVQVNDANALCRLACAGAGVAILPDFLVQRALNEGTLQHVLPEWRVDAVGVFAVWPPNAPKGGLTARFVEFIGSAKT
ncbi:MAG: LysR family transcriptional regulator [Pseudomonadota bacterium]